MTDKVQKIREEVERLKESGCASPIVICDTLLAFIDSLQEEPKFKVGDTIQKKNDNNIKYSIVNVTNDGYRALRGLSDTIIIWFSEQDQWELVEEPVSDDFEEEMDRYIEKNFYGSADDGFFSNRTKRELEVEDVVRIGCHFAAWQKEQDQSTIELAEDHAMFAGMEKMREQMMKDAIDGEITKISLNDYLRVVSDVLPLKDDSEWGTRVKLIIIKQEKELE